VSRLLAVQDDVEDRVRPRVAGEGTPKLALWHKERMRRLAAPVEHAWDHALSAQATRIGGTAPFARLDLELDSFAGHFGAEV
jgi:hypothetical protein